MTDKNELLARLEKLRDGNATVISSFIEDTNGYFRAKETLATYCPSGIATLYVLAITGIVSNLSLFKLCCLSRSC